MPILSAGFLGYIAAAVFPPEMTINNCIMFYWNHYKNKTNKKNKIFYQEVARPLY